jgi:Predicted DNA binding protein
MILRVVLQIKGRPAMPLEPHDGSVVTILDVKAENGTQRLLVEIRGEDRILSALEGNFTRVSKSKYLGTLRVKGLTEGILAKYVIVNGLVNIDYTEWTVILNGYGELRRLLKELHEGNVEVKVKKVTKYKSGDVLTARQEQILRIALEAGYFEFPRRISAKALAEKLELSVSSLSEIIRRAEKNVISNYFQEKGL